MVPARWTDGEDEAYVDVVLRRRLVRTAFQAIVRLDTALPCAFHALTRGPLGSPLEHPERLAGAAAARGVATQLDQLCFATALDAAERARLAAPLRLFVPRAPISLLHDNAADRRVPAVLELSVHAPIDALRSAAARARALGYEIALDDVVREDAVGVVDAIRPDFVMVAASACDVLAPVLAAFSALPIAVGLDTEFATAGAIAAGIEYGYGLRFGRPDLLVRAPVVFDHMGLAASSATRDHR
jgi:EAL domain-containing protein (putative c-di-GMP-specific phosphodiesterase class I)